MAATHKRLAALMSSASVEWYTPSALYQRISAFLGPEMFDPCACPATDAPVGLAGRENGLAVPWRGRVFINPPYGRSIGAWIRKALTEPYDEAILLVPARTDTRWFNPLFAHTILFIRGRLYFSEGGPATFPSALVYIGPRARAFAETFGDLGSVMQAMPLPSDGTRAWQLW